MTIGMSLQPKDLGLQSKEYLELFMHFINMSLRQTASWKHGLRARIRKDAQIIDFQYVQGAIFQTGYHIVVDEFSGISLLKVLQDKESFEVIYQTAWNIQTDSMIIGAEIAGEVAQRVEEHKYLSLLERNLLALTKEV